MIERLIDKLYWRDRDKVIPCKLALFLGHKLCSGYTLVDALLQASEEIDSHSQKLALNRAASIIKSSEKDTAEDNSEETENANNNTLRYALFDNRLELRQKDRYVLASSLPNELKGAIIKNWSENNYHGTNVMGYMFIIFTTFVICVAAFVFSMFAMPQFFEICLGMNVPINEFLKPFYRLNDSGGFIFMMFCYFGFIIITLFVGNLISDVGKMQEEADLLALLSSVNKSEQWVVLDLLANRNCFPRIHKMLRKAIDAIENGEKQDDSFDNTGLSSYAKWFLHLSFFENDRSVLKEGSMILNERIMLSSLSAIKALEVFIVIIQSLFFGVFAYFLFSNLNNMIIGCLS